MTNKVTTHTIKDPILARAAFLAMREAREALTSAALGAAATSSFDEDAGATRVEGGVPAYIQHALQAAVAAIDEMDVDRGLSGLPLRWKGEARIRITQAQWAAIHAGLCLLMDMGEEDRRRAYAVRMCGGVEEGPDVIAAYEERWDEEVHPLFARGVAFWQGRDVQ